MSKYAHMRDTDRDRISYVVARRSGPVKTLADLKGRTIATGAIDSPQATLIPLCLLRRGGLSPGVDVTVRRFDVLVGKHGDHVGGERDALACLTQGGAAACAMLDLNWEGWIKDGTIDANEFSIVGETDRFDHCVFTVCQALDSSAEKAWLDALFAMSQLQMAIPRDALADRANLILKKLGPGNGSADRAMGFHFDGDYIRWAQRSGPPACRRTVRRGARE